MIKNNEYSRKFALGIVFDQMNFADALNVNPESITATALIFKC